MFHRWVLGRMKLKNERDLKKEGKTASWPSEVGKTSKDRRQSSGPPGGGGEQRQSCTQGLFQGWSADRPECRERELKPASTEWS